MPRAYAFSRTPIFTQEAAKKSDMPDKATEPISETLPRMEPQGLVIAPRPLSPWQPIETAQSGRHILFFPLERGRFGEVSHPPRTVVDHYPVSYPRKPTHWMPLPPPPQEGASDGKN